MVWLTLFLQHGLGVHSGWALVGIESSEQAGLVGSGKRRLS